jgi:hypothetical protein
MQRARKHHKPTELDFDLADVRKAKRLINRALAELEKIEKRLLKKRPKPLVGAQPQQGSPEELALAIDMYRKAHEFRGGDRSADFGGGE